MLRRVLLRSLVPAGILLACFAQLVWNGRHARKVLAENEPHPLLSTGKTDVNVWVPTYEPGRIYDLTFTRGEESLPLPSDARLKVQLASAGRTRLLVVRPGHLNTDVSWRALLTGREKLQVVADRDWIDLGAAPLPGETLKVQLTGLLPGEFGFAQLFARKEPHFARILVVRPESPRARMTNTSLRYRFDREESVPARETLARFFFTISCSRVLQATGAAAIVLLFAGWWWLREQRYGRAAAALVPAVTLLHVCCLPPFQGPDEVAHEATVEALLWNPAMLKPEVVVPESISVVYRAIGYCGFAGSPETPLPIDSNESRAAIRRILESRLAVEARTPVAPTADDRVLDPRERARFYYLSFRAFGPLLRRMSVVDRLEAYVVISAAASLLFFGAGLLVLSRFGASASVSIVYGLVALLPYSVGVVASCSNYSPAIGIGQFLAACLVAGVLTESVRQRLLAAVLFTGVSLVGIGVWDDFVFFAVPSTVVLTVLSAIAAYRLPAGSRRRLAGAFMILLGIVLTGTVAFALATGRIRSAISSFGARLPRSLGRFEDPSFWLLLAAAAAPLVIGLVLAFAIARAPRISGSDRRLAAFARSGVLVALFVVMFFLTRWSPIPFETTRLDYPDEVAAHWTSFWSNNFAFDQDTLFWKMYWGVFGYADVSYPNALYALARWACVGLFLALPVLSWRFTQRSPVRSALLLLASAWALSACVVTNSLRYFAPTNPWGRFLLPAFALAALPVLVRITDSPSRVRALRLALAALVVLHVWTAIALLGSRYAVGL